MLEYYTNAIISFLQNELIQYKIKHKDNIVIISINEPTEWIGKPDTNFHCTIYCTKKDNGKIELSFYSFRAVSYDPKFCGSFFKFISLVKNISYYEARQLFYTQYLLPQLNISNYTTILHNNTIIQELKQKQETILSNDIVLPPNSRLLQDTDTEYINYLLQRGVSLQRIKQLPIFIDQSALTMNKGIIFPIYENGKLCYYAKRFINDDPKFKHRWIHSKVSNTNYIWNFENVAISVIITEGIFDAIHFENGVALLGTGRKQQFDKIIQKDFLKIIIALDNDAAGRQARLRWAEYLVKNNCTNVYIVYYNNYKDCKDIGEIMQKYKTFNIEENSILYSTKVLAMFKMNILL